jgi:2',3'-cyclic-nucleotide 2'-phosphodiesterase (5'-nucleotidase family)
MTIGNHEFDYDLDYLKSRIENDSFPYLVSNINLNNKPLYEVWNNVINGKIYELDKVKIGVIGLATLQTKSTTSGNLTGLEILDYYNIIVKESKRLKENGANAIVLLAHFGLMCSDKENLTSNYDINIYNSSSFQTTCKETEELNVLLNKLDTSIIDVVVAGHTHNINHHWINGIPVIQSTGNQYSNVMYIPFDKETLNIVHDKIQIEGPLPSCELVFENSKRCEFVLLNDTSQGKLKKIKFHGKDLKLNQDLKEKLDNEREKVNTLMDNKIVENHVFLNTSNDKETHLTNMVVDIGRKVSGADFAFFNLGGYRTSWYPGTISELDLHLMFPFDNEFVTFEMSGEEIIRTLKTINRRIIYPSSGLIQVYRKSDENNILVDAKVFDGVYEMNIEPFKTYVVCVNDFLFNGGSQFKHVMKWYKIKNKNPIGIVRKYVSEYLKNMGNIYEDSFMDTDHPRYRYIE